MVHDTPISYRGPYYGIDNTRSPRELEPGYAADAKNVILAEGRIRPRPPFSGYGGQSDWMVSAESGAHTNIVAMKNVELQGRYRQLLVIATARNGARYFTKGRLYSIQYDFFHNQYLRRDLGVDCGSASTSFVIVNDRCYIIDGHEQMYSTDGTREGTFRIGMDPPPEVHIEPVFPQGTGLPPGRSFQYAITYYDKDHDRESNAIKSEVYSPVNPSILQGFYVRRRLPPDQTTPQPGENEHVTHWRVYRRDVTLNQPFFRLVREASLDDWFIIDEDPDPTLLSSVVNGPFAPFKNTPPSGFTCAAYYKDRMFYGNRGDKLFYSAFGDPGSVDPLDFIDVQGDPASGVTGLAEMAGQLVVLKPKSIWIVSGVVQAASNEDVALAVAPPASSHTVYKTKSPVGCAQLSGNGAIVVGSPPMVHFNADDGFYAFDGINERKLTQRIKPLWREFIRAEGGGDIHHNIQYARDTDNDILYMVDGGFTSTDHRLGRKILAYHFSNVAPDGLGSWTYLELDQTGEAYKPSCLATPLSSGRDTGSTDGNDEDFNFSNPYKGELIIGTTGGHIFESNRVDLLDVPKMRYVTGMQRLVEGYRVMVHLMKWLHLTPSTTHTQPDPGRKTTIADPITYNVPRNLRVGFRALNDIQDTLIQISLATKSYSRIPVRRTVTELQLVIEDADDGVSKWSDSLAIVGWMLEAKIAGEH